MDSQLSKAPDHLVRLREAIRSGNWKAAEALAGALAQGAVPQGQQELGEYLHALAQTVILAKASRSVAIATFSRVRAAARFQSSSLHDRARQNFVDPT